MITAEQKPFDEIYAMVKEYGKLCILGCGSCVTVCMAGGEKEVNIMASVLNMAHEKSGSRAEIREAVIERQCDREFFDSVADDIVWSDAVLSMACGVGVQMCAEVFPDKRIFPALDTRFYGAAESQGIWIEKCAGCGRCIVHEFGGICPIARCSKNLLNGPCGGSQDGMCEIDPENTPCGWQLIYDRMKELGMADRLEENQPLKDWSTGRSGGPGKIIKEDMVL